VSDATKPGAPGEGASDASSPGDHETAADGPRSPTTPRAKKPRPRNPEQRARRAPTQPSSEASALQEEEADRSPRPEKRRRSPVLGSVPSKDPEVKRQVNGLAPEERRIGFVAAGGTAVLYGALFLPHLHEKLSKGEIPPVDAFFVGLALAALLLVGTLANRRAALGFAAFLAGFAVVGSSPLLGAPYLFMAGWLVLRAFRKEHAPKVSGATATGSPASGTDAVGAASTQPARPRNLLSRLFTPEPRASGARNGNGSPSSSRKPSSARSDRPRRSHPAKNAPATPPASKRYTPPKAKRGSTRRSSSATGR